MESKNLQFKTNLNCGNCVSKVQADLDNADGICEWNVDTTKRYHHSVSTAHGSLPRF